MLSIETLELKKLLERAAFNIQTTFDATKLLDQVPLKSNYFYETRFSLLGGDRFIVEVNPETFCESSTTIRNHFTLKGLNSKCKLLLSPEQVLILENIKKCLSP